MALFPAYADESAKCAEKEEDKPQSEDWLTNSSFKVDIQVLQEPTKRKSEHESHSDSPPKKRKHKKKKRDEPKEATKIETIKPLEDKDFSVDVKGNREFLTVNTISRPAAPRYTISYYLTKSTRKRKRKFKRYFKFFPETEHLEIDPPKITKSGLNDIQPKEDNQELLKEEESLSQTTATYNKSLNDNPKDIKMWMEYVHFQDSLYQFEKVHRKGSMAKAQRVLAERKLSIIDKALTHNPNCEILLRERLKVAVSTYPADELQVQLKILVEKDQGNIIFWQGYIEATQCSMSHCNTPAVLNLYSKCLSILHKLRRNSTLEKPVMEESILRILYQCGLFLKQAGLFEQLWTLLRLYLELNLSPMDKNKFNISSSFKEQQLIDLEEVVFSSELPLHELWLRTEKLRESCHWLPFSGEGECEDPQRLVFTEDVNELIHPITMPNNIFKMTATILTLLKIPLLPCRHTTMQELGLDYVPWGIDSIESLLPIYLPLYIQDDLNCSFLSDNKLAVGPQYLKKLPGQEEYLEFILTTMKNSADCLNGDDKVALNVWWFRFQRVLLILGKLNLFRMSQGLKKKFKNNLKNFLKQSENRNNQIYYCEYALTELVLEDKDKAIGIFQTAIDAGKTTDFSLENPPVTQCYLLKNLVDVLVSENRNNEAIQKLSSFVLCRTASSNPNDVKEASSKFKLITIQLLNKKHEKRLLSHHFLPNFLVDFLVCHGWFAYLTNGVIEAGTFIENTIIKIQENYDDSLAFETELLYEFYVAMLYKYSTQNSGSGTFKILDDVFCRAIELFPNNLFLMRILAQVQTISRSVGQHWWKIENLLLKTGRSLPVLITVLVSMKHYEDIRATVIDTFTGQKYDFSTDYRNKMLSLFRKVTKSSMCSRRCGLLWRLYLQFVNAHFDPNLCRNVYYTAVEECPWLKALYIDAAIYIPAELAQIQDLIIEKQLRLHVTPEELDVLRT